MVSPTYLLVKTIFSLFLPYVGICVTIFWQIVNFDTIQSFKKWGWGWGLKTNPKCSRYHPNGRKILLWKILVNSNNVEEKGETELKFHHIWQTPVDLQLIFPFVTSYSIYIYTGIGIPLHEDCWTSTWSCLCNEMHLWKSFYCFTSYQLAATNKPSSIIIPLPCLHWRTRLIGNNVSYFILYFIALIICNIYISSQTHQI